MDDLLQLVFEIFSWGTGEVLLRIIPQNKFKSETQLVPRSETRSKLRQRKTGRRKRRRDGSTYYRRETEPNSVQNHEYFSFKKLPDGTIVLGIDIVSIIGLMFWILMIAFSIFLISYFDFW
jgi:hypothetical protein